MLCVDDVVASRWNVLPEESFQLLFFSRNFVLDITGISRNTRVVMRQLQAYGPNSVRKDRKTVKGSEAGVFDEPAWKIAHGERRWIRRRYPRQQLTRNLQPDIDLRDHAGTPRA